MLYAESLKEERLKLEEVNLYIAKFNICNLIFEVYDEKIELGMILRDFVFLLSKYKDGTEQIDKSKVVVNKPIIHETPEGGIYKTTDVYKLSITDIDYDNLIVIGYLIRDTHKLVKQVDDVTNENIYNLVSTQEDVPFYFDVNKELIVFIKKKLLGNNQFTEKLQEIFNKIYNVYSNVEYDTQLCTIYQIMSQKEDVYDYLIKNKVKLSKLRYEIVAPNPNSRRLSELEEAGKNRVEQMHKRNITKEVVEYESSSKEGINLEEEGIKHEFKVYNNINMNFMNEVSNGYGQMSAIDTNGTNVNDHHSTPLTITYHIESDKKISTQFKDGAIKLINKFFRINQGD